MLRGERLRASGVAVALPLLALAALAALAYSGRASSRTQLDQVGEDEFLDPTKTETASDMALRIQGILRKEAVLLKKISARAKLREHVNIDVLAGQIGKVGPKGFQGYPGPAGFQGEQGSTGKPGLQGPRGIQGPKGIKGIAGASGDQGTHGADGDDGQAGPPGPRGRRGRAGPRGAEGKLGANGQNGVPGLNGPSGPRGQSMWEGVIGVPGKVGPPGAPGRAGDPGQDGARGAPGPQGILGSNGPVGDAGIPGEPGKSVCASGNSNGQQMCCGSVPAGKWTKKSDYAMEAQIDMTKCRFIEPPMIFTQLSANGNGRKSLNTESNVVNTAENELSLDTGLVTIRAAAPVFGSEIGYVMGSWGWTLQWCAYGIVSPSKKLPTYEVCCGSSNTKWENRGADGISLDVDSSGCGWEAGVTPTYFTELSDATCGNELIKSPAMCAARTIGYQSPYSPTYKSFRIYANAMPGTDLPSPSDASKYNWQVKWCGVTPARPQKRPVGGYPCTSPRLLIGNNDQGVFSDFGKVCCDTTTASGWGAAGSDSITKTIDISQCKFEKIAYLFTNVRGDKVDGFTNTIGSTAYSPTKEPNKFKLYLYTGGKFKFYNAAQHHWKIQWCAYGR